MRASFFLAVLIGSIHISSGPASAQLAPLQSDEPGIVETAAPMEEAKLSPEVRSKALNGESVSVLIQLSDAVSPDEARAIRSRHAAKLELLDKQTRQLSRSKAPHAAIRHAAADRDAEIRAQRRELTELAARSYMAQQDRVSSRLETMGARLMKRFRTMNAIQMVLPPAAILALEDMPGVVRVVENRTDSFNLVKSAETLGAPVLWNNGYTGGTQSVAILDSGVDGQHLGFGGLRISASQQIDGAHLTGCADPADNHPWDLAKHGTHVAGIVASQGLPGAASLKGVAYGVGELITIKIGAMGNGSEKCPDVVITLSDVLAAIEQVVIETSARVVNMSFGGATNLDDSLENWFMDQVADTYDIVFVVAAGNDGERALASQMGNYAVSYNAIAVANLDTNQTVTRSDDAVAPSSSKGPTRKGRKKPEIAAPGTEIISLVPGSSRVAVEKMTGTSMAAPHIAGGVALLLDAGAKGLKEVKALLLNSADGAGWNRNSGFGAANLENALQQVDFVVSEAVQPQTPRFYRVSVDGLVRATLAWNRHVDKISAGGRSAFGDFRNLDLVVFDEATHRAVASSTSTIDNVEKVGVTGKGTAILKVSQAGDADTPEPFALAFSHGAFEEIAGPKIALSCAGTPEVSASMKVAIVCRVQNTGAMSFQGVTFKTSGPAGFSATGVPSSIKLNPAQSAEIKFEMNTSLTARGPVSYSAIMEGTVFGDTYTAKVPMTVTIRAPKPQNCAPVITPASGTLTLSSAAQTFTVKVQFPGYDPKEPGACSYNAMETSGWFSLSGRKAGQGDGEFTVNVSQNNRNSLNAKRSHQFRIMPGVDYFFEQYHLQ